MDVDPLIVVKSSKSISSAKATKILSKFYETHQQSAAGNLNLTNRQRISLVPDDVLEKIALVIGSLKGSNPELPVGDVDDSQVVDIEDDVKIKHKKRKSEVIDVDNNDEEDEASSEKKDKKKKKRKSNHE